MLIRRVKRTKNEARTAYNRLSRIYDRLAGASETALMQLGLDMLELDKGGSVLEIGSGTGKALVELAIKAGETGAVHGIDLSPGMLRQAHDRLVKAGLQDQVTLLEGDGARLPYSSACFDAVFISFTLELFDTPEISLVLAECQRVLKPNGRLEVVAMLKTENPGGIVRLYEWFHDHFPAFADCRPIDAQARIQAAGFRIEHHLQRELWGLPVELLVAQKA